MVAWYYVRMKVLYIILFVITALLAVRFIGLVVKVGQEELVDWNGNNISANEARILGYNFIQQNCDVTRRTGWRNIPIDSYHVEGVRDGYDTWFVGPPDAPTIVHIFDDQDAPYVEPNFTTLMVEGDLIWLAGGATGNLTVENFSYWYC